MAGSGRRGAGVLPLIAVDAAVLLSGVVAVVRYEGRAVPTPVGFGVRPTPEGRAELRVLRDDPVLDFRARGTALRSVTEKPGGLNVSNARSPTEIRQLFDMDGEPGETVDAYRPQAEASGWSLVQVNCSRFSGGVFELFTRQYPGFRATLAVSATVGRPPPDGVRRGLSVTLTATNPNRAPPRPESLSLPRRDPHCLRNLDPSDPALQPPARVPASAEAICALLPLAQARRAAPSVIESEPSVVPEPTCHYRPGTLAERGFSVKPAPDPRARYEAMQAAPQAAADRFFLLEYFDGTLSGAWVETSAGPVVVETQLPVDQLTAVARLLSRA